MFMKVFGDYAYYYNAFYKDKDYSAEALQVDSLLSRYGENIHSIINYGCGTGKHDIQLFKQGYQCTGIDMSKLMIEQAQKNAKHEGLIIDFSVADIREYEPQKKYDAVISLFHVMSYQIKNQDILAAFCSARKALERGGIFLFDTWYGPGVLSDKPVTRVREIEDEKNKLIRIANPILYDKENAVDVCYDVYIIEKETEKTRIINEIHKMRYFFRPEVEFFLQEAGFKLVDNLDCITLEETDYNSWTSYFVAKAI